jgi:hypothetical protein
MALTQNNAIAKARSAKFSLIADFEKKCQNQAKEDQEIRTQLRLMAPSALRGFIRQKKVLEELFISGAVGRWIMFGENRIKNEADAQQKIGALANAWLGQVSIEISEIRDTCLLVKFRATN